MSRLGAVAFTRRMRQCLKLTAEGYTQKEIGLMLGVSRRTVIAHLTRARMMTGAKNMPHLVAVSMKLRLFDDLDLGNERKTEVVRIDREEIWKETKVDGLESG